MITPISKIRLALATLATTCLGYTANAQLQLGLQYGTTISHTDATPDGTGTHFGLYSQFQSPYRFLDFRINLNFGTLNGGNKESQTALYYENQFSQGDLQLQCYPLRTLTKCDSSRTLYYLSGLYAAGGIGIMGSQSTIHELTGGNFRYQGNYEGIDMVIPVSFGMDIPLSKAFQKKGLRLNIKYQVNYCTTDKMDGYNPDLPSNKGKDVYSLFAMGLSYAF